jgi:hypothetical protein
MLIVVSRIKERAGRRSRPEFVQRRSVPLDLGLRSLLSEPKVSQKDVGHAGEANPPLEANQAFIGKPAEV